IRQSLHPEDGLALSRVCMQIHDTEKALNLAARPYLNRCLDICHGLCCRNVYLDEIIGMEDFLYILVLNPELAPEIEKLLKHLNYLVTADCICLEGRKGPCIFPSDIRPEVCITSFCIETPNATKQIGAVKWGFQKLGWSARLIGVRTFFRKIGFIP
ncbi:MAG: hypothetical protein WA151_14665, partial [Desulfatirhabdiaceae bacterium]